MDYSTFPEREKLSDCPVCMMRYDNPVQFRNCGHSLCLNCANSLRQNHPPRDNPNAFCEPWTCPVCRTGYTPGMWQPNLALRAVLALVDRYPNNDAMMEGVFKEHREKTEQMEKDVQAALETRVRLSHCAVSTVAHSL